MIHVYDIEVFAYDWIVSFEDEQGVKSTFHNDLESLIEFYKQVEMLCGFNCKHYDGFILMAILAGATTAEVKELNDWIIKCERRGWEHPKMSVWRRYIPQFDLKDDMQDGQSLKGIEGNLYMPIEETEVPFDIDRPLLPDEVESVIKYCEYDVSATRKLMHIRKDYLQTKINLGAKKGLTPIQSLSKTNAALTAIYLDAQPVRYDDEKEYKYPDNLLREYIPQEAFDFFDAWKAGKFDGQKEVQTVIHIGDCEVTLALGGIHGDIPNYVERSNDTRTIRNQDVGSYYPHIMIIEGYCSRAIPDSQIYANMLAERMRAKKAGDTVTANALKLVANTTYGAMLRDGNPLYDARMGRSVCITGQLRLLELANHLYTECETLKVIQCNTDGIMVSLETSDLDKYYAICKEWCDRGRYTLEEEIIRAIIQKDVNGYIEVATNGKLKVKGGYLVRGISTAGAFKVNNNATIVPEAIIQYLVNGIPIADTINACDDIFKFQLIAKAGSKYSAVHHIKNGRYVETQKCNRVYATNDVSYGKLYKTHAETGRVSKVESLPPCCIIDNNNELTIDAVNKNWYISLAERRANEFIGIKEKTIKRNTRAVNTLKQKITEVLNGKRTS